MDPATRSELLKQWALEAGFDAAGVAVLEPVEHADAFVDWLQRGGQAGMAWMENRLQARLDPRKLFPGARSALCVALAYEGFESDTAPGDETIWPRVARYARGSDYHDVMGSRLHDLGERIAEAFPGTRWKAWVDTGPILERELAARAGLGSVGKNTMLLRRDFGSWFLLGELVLSFDLAPDEPLADMCGSCTACLDACPTGALPEPYRLDSRRCISYWTIEHRGTMPEAVRDLIQDWVFGCDVCQEVCPWNRAPSRAPDTFSAIPAARRSLSLTGLLGLSREAYVERFRGSAMKRSRLAGLQRNAALVLAREGGATAREALSSAVHEVAPEVREDVEWALRRCDCETDPPSIG